MAREEMPRILSAYFKSREAKRKKERERLKRMTPDERRAYRQAKAERAARQAEKEAERVARRAAVREEARRREAARVAALSPEARAAEEAEQAARKEAYRLSHTIRHPPPTMCAGCRKEEAVLEHATMGSMCVECAELSR